MASYECILLDNPLPAVRRVTLNRPEKRNALNNQLRTEILQALEEADCDPDVRVSILRGQANVSRPVMISAATIRKVSRTILPMGRASGPAM